MKVVGIGEALWDVFPEGRKIGGAPANFAFHAAQFGFDSYAVSAVGNDEAGEELARRFTEAGLKYCLEKVEYPTGTVQVTLDGRGVPSYHITEQVAWDNIPYTPALRALAKDCGAVCFGSLAQRSAQSRRTINAFIDDMPDGSLKIFDINLRQHYYDEEVIVSSLEKSNVLKINDEEVLVVRALLKLGEIDMEAVCRTLLETYRLDMVIMTMGEKGSCVFTRDLCSRVDTPKVEVASTVGAGDSFTGSFIASILKGRDIRTAHRTAVDVSAFVCTQVGAMPKLPSELTD